MTRAWIQIKLKNSIGEQLGWSLNKKEQLQQLQLLTLNWIKVGTNRITALPSLQFNIIADSFIDSDHSKLFNYLNLRSIG